MKKHKGLVIAIIIIAILIILAVSAFVVIYMFTDIFKTDKQLFAKYATSMMEEKTAFFPTILKEYTTKKQTTPYENNGSLTANIAAESPSSATETDTTTAQINSILNFSNNTRINFSGKVDKANNKTEQSINIFYTNDTSLPFNYKQVGDIYALQADFVLPNYIGIENNNIPDLLQKLGMSVNSIEIPSKIELQELQSLNLSEEEITHLYNNYLTPVVTNLSDDKFSKIKNSDGSNDYILTLTMDDIKGILLQILQVLSQDTVAINKINSIYQEKFSSTEVAITTDQINNLIANIQETEFGEADIITTITVFNGKVNKIDFNVSMEDETTVSTITITKDENNSNLTYNIDLTMQNEDAQSSIELELSYTNINTNSVVENHNITATLNDVMNLEYNFSNNVVFANTVGITDFDLNNTIILNNYPENEVQTFLSQLIPIIAQKNEEQMNEIGYPTEFINPVYMWVMGPSLTIYIYNMASDVISSADLSSQQAAAYNLRFLQFEGVRTGSQVRTLLNEISSNNRNASDAGQVIVVNSEDYTVTEGTKTAPSAEENKDEINDGVSSIAILSGKQYKVTFAYDPNTGYITACGITEVESSNSNNTTVNDGNIISP